jgi:hypothetical protein
MDPKKWGPHAWIFLHSVAETYPENPAHEERRHYYLFFSLLDKVLPCVTCRNNLQNHWRVRPLDAKALSSRRNLKMWLNDLHNMVNYSLGKSIVSLEEGDRLLQNPKISQKERDPLNFYLIVLVIIIAVIFLIYINKCN